MIHCFDTSEIHFVQIYWNNPQFGNNDRPIPSVLLQIFSSFLEFKNFIYLYPIQQKS